MADEFLDLFQQLFQSSEIWSYLGVLGVIIVCLLMSYKVKGAFPFCFLAMVLMGIQYFDEITAGGFFTWHVIMLILGAIMCIPIGIDKFRD